MNAKKVFAGAVAAAAVCTLSVCGTLAYLTARTEAVTNTFTVGSIFNEDGGIRLEEHEPVKQDDGTYQLSETVVTAADYDGVLPADTLPKDPKVTVEGLTADAYIFVEVVDETESLQFAVDAAWTLLPDAVGKNGGAVYSGGLLTGSTEGTDWSQTVLADNEVTVADDAEGDLGSLSFYSYICQAQGFDTAAAAWDAAFAG